MNQNPDGMDDEATLAFCYELAQSTPQFQEALERLEKFWSPDQPPSTIFLGKLGTAFATNFDAITAEDRAVIMAQVEDGVSDEGDLGDAVTTGFIEAMIHQAERDDTWLTVQRGLGPLSRQYAEAYRNASRALPDGQE